MGIGQSRFDAAASLLLRETQAVTVEFVSDDLDWMSIRPLWEALLAQTTHPSPYWTWDYLNVWRENLGRVCPQSGRPFGLYVAIVRHENSVVGIFPMFVERAQGFAMRRLRMLGFNGGVGPADMTEEPIYLTLPGSEAHAFDGLAQAVHKLRMRRVFDMVDLRLWIRDGIALPAKFQFRRKKGPAIAEVPETWAAYRKLLTKSMRDNIGYYPRLLVRHGHSFEIKIVREAAEMRNAVDILVGLHKKRHKASTDKRRVDHFPTEVEARYQASALANLASSERAFVGILEIDGRPVAAQAFMEYEPTLVMGYSGFDPEWSTYSPLMILQSDIFQKAIEHGIRRLDFQQGDKMWQTRWQAKPEGQIVAITIVRKNPLALAKAACYFAKRELIKGWQRRRIPELWTKITSKPLVIFGVDLARYDPHLASHAIRLGHLACHPAASHLMHLGRRF